MKTSIKLEQKNTFLRDRDYLSKSNNQPILKAETEIFLPWSDTKQQANHYHLFPVSVWNQLRRGIRQMGLKMSASLLIEPTEEGGFRSEARGAC